MSHTFYSKSKFPAIVAGVILSFYIIFMMSYMLYLSNSTHRTTVENLNEVALQATRTIQARIASDLRLQKTLALALASQDDVFDPEQAIDYLNQKADLSFHKRMGVIMPNGDSYTTDGLRANFSERIYFQQAMHGNATISDTLVDVSDGEYINVYAVPITQEGKICAVLFSTIAAETYGRLIDTQSFNGKGVIYVVKSDGTPLIRSIRPADPSGALEQTLNRYDLSGLDRQDYDKLSSDMQHGLSGSFQYLLDGQPQYVCYMPLDVNDWYVHCLVAQDVIGFDSNRLMRVSLGATFLTVAVIATLLGYILLHQEKTHRSFEKIAFYDTLTNLPNWQFFERECEKILHDNPEAKYAVVVFDIDHFKSINDIYGYAEGDRLLKYISEILSEKTRAHEFAARISADNFVMLVYYQTDQNIINRIHVLTQLLRSYSDNVNLSLSFGIYKLTDRTLDPGRLCDRARLARETVKGSHHPYWAFYNHEMRDRVMNEQLLENSMETALKNGEFLVYLQPKYSFETGDLSGAEALSRWQHPEHGLIPPCDFIPLFEKNGFIRELDFYMFEQVCHILQDWREAGKRYASLPISVNLSRLHLGNVSLTRQLSQIAADYCIDPAQVEIELTETIESENTDIMRRRLSDLKSAGFCLSMDDFGAGYSSLHTLKDLDIDFLKLDKGFLSETSSSQRGQSIIKNLIQMSKDLSLKTVAEGIETKEQAAFLKEMGCDIAQGFYYARPMPLGEFEALAERDYVSSTQQQSSEHFL